MIAGLEAFIAGWARQRDRRVGPGPGGSGGRRVEFTLTALLSKG